MEWFVVATFLIFIGGLGIVTYDAIAHAKKSSPNNTKPTH
jgi:hypothetical protein